MSVQVNNTDSQLNIITNGVLDVYNVKTIKSVSRAIDASGNHYISINFIANDKNNSLRIPLTEVTSPITWTNDTAGAIAAVEDIRDWLSEAIEVEISEANDSILVYGYDAANGNNEAISVNATGQVAIQDGGNSITIDATSLPLPTGAATEATLLDVKTSVQLLDDCVGTDNTAAPAKSLVVAGVTAGGTQQTIEVNASGHVNISDGGGSITVDTTQLPATLGKKASTGSVSVTLANDELGIARTTGMIRPTTSGNVNTVAANFFSVSVANVGAANGSVLGGAANIKPGEVLNFSADAVNNYFTTFAYDATGTEFIIIFVY